MLERNHFPADSAPRVGTATWAMVVFAEIVGFPEWNKHAGVTSVSPLAHPLCVESARFPGSLMLLTQKGRCFGNAAISHITCFLLVKQVRPYCIR